MKKTTILVVDDSPSVVNLIVTALETEHFSVASATNGHEALKKLKKCSVDLLITDDNMPELTGYELAVKVKTMPEFSRLPIIIVSGNHDATRISDLIEKRIISCFIPKPFIKISQLINMVRFLIDQNRLVEN